MTFLADLDQTGERVIPDLEQESWNVDVHLSRYQYAAASIQPGWTVLDYGCGSGYGLHLLAGETGGLCVGVDKLEAVAYAQNRYEAPNIQYVAADITRPAARFGKFDLIVSFDVIEHLDDIDTYLANIAAQLRDEKSVAFISTPWSLRRNNLHPLHNPFHTCEMSAIEFVERLQRHFEVEELTMAMGMLARLRRPGTPVKSFDGQVVTLSSTALIQIENYIEQCGRQCEQADVLRHDVARLSAETPRKGGVRAALRRLDRSLRTAVGVDRTHYHCLPLAGGQNDTAHFTADEDGLAGLDLLLAANQPLAGDVHIALYAHGVCVAQAHKPALLISSTAPSRFLFPSLPASKGVAYRLHVSYQTPASTRKLKIWCNAQGEPLVRTLYRRFEWPGQPHLIPLSKLLAGPDHLPPLADAAEPAVDGAIAGGGVEGNFVQSRGQKMREAYARYGIGGPVRLAQEYITWRLRTLGPS